MKGPRGTVQGPPSPQEGPPAEPVRAREAMVYRPPEPYVEGNKAAVKHGAYSADLVNRTAEEIWVDMEEQLRLMPGYLDADQILVDEMREVVAQLVQLRKYRAEHGLLDAAGNPRSFVWLEDKLGRRLVDLGKALGLGASERAKVFGAFMAAGRAHAEALAAQERLRSKLKPPARKRQK